MDRLLLSITLIIGSVIVSHSSSFFFF